MRSYPDIQMLDEAPSDHLQGHVWVKEYIDGDLLRFDIASEGHLRFGDEERVFRGEAPTAFRHAVRFVERMFALDDYLPTVANPVRYTFVGVATHRHAIDYDWERLLGIDIWDNEERDGCLHPQRAPSPTSLVSSTPRSDRDRRGSAPKLSVPLTIKYCRREPAKGDED